MPGPPSTGSASASCKRSWDAFAAASPPSDELLRLARRMLGPTRADREADGVLRSRRRDGVGRGARFRRVGRPRAPARGAAHSDGRRRARRRGCEPRAAQPATRPPSSWPSSGPRLRLSSAVATPRRRRSASSVSTRSSVPTGSFSPSEQEAMVREVATSPSRVVCVVGLAGAGKTTATHAVAQVFAQAEIPVLGAAPSGVAAEKLQDETGIPATTLHRLLDQARRDGGLPSGSVLVVDEAGMAETRILAPVLDACRAGEREGDPDRRPAPAPRRRRRRTLRRHRRARRCCRSDREPPPAR